MKPFLIRHPETRVEFELADVAFFLSEYKPKGFGIVDPAPTGYRVPDADEIAAADKPGEKAAEPPAIVIPKAEKAATASKLD